MVNVPYAGHTNPTLPLASELVKRGHSTYYFIFNCGIGCIAPDQRGIGISDKPVYDKGT